MRTTEKVRAENVKFMARILIVEDDPALREVLQLTLGRAGHAVLAAADGREAAALYRTKPLDLVVTDIYMPNTDGLEVLIDLRAHHPTLKIIAISGQIVRGNMLPVAASLGASRTLAKPFQPHELINAVNEVLGLA